MNSNETTAEKALLEYGPKINRGNIRDLLALYEGGETLQSNIEAFIKAPGSGPEAEIRESAKKRAAKHGYINYLNQITNFYSSYLFKDPIILANSSTSYWETFKTDCDNQGTNLHDFFRDRLNETLVTGYGPYVAEFPRLSQIPTNRQEWEDLNAGNIKLRALSVANLADYELDTFGNLSWAKFITRKFRKPGPFSSRETLDIVEIWTNSIYQKWEIQYSGMQKTAIKTEEYGHGFSKCPVELFALPNGYQLGQKLKAPQVLLLLYKISEIINLSAGSYPMLIIRGPSPSTAESVEALYGKSILTEANGGAEWLTQTTEVVDSLSKQSKQTVEEMYRIANLQNQGQAGDSYQLMRSGSARWLDMEAGRLYLQSLGHYVREALGRTMSMIASAREEQAPDIGGFEHLNSIDPSELLQMKKDLPSLLVSKTANIELETRIALKMMPDLSESTRSRIVEEIKEHYESNNETNKTISE